MQRECNDVAFGELTLSTRLKRNKKKIHPSLKSWYRRSVQLLNMSCRWAPPQEGIAFTNQYLSKYLESSQTSTATPQTWALFWRLELDNNLRCVKPAKRRGEWEITAARRQENERSLLQDGKQEDVWWWWWINGHWSWRGAKRLQKGPTAVTERWEIEWTIC